MFTSIRLRSALHLSAYTEQGRELEPASRPWRTMCLCGKGQVRGDSEPSVGTVGALKGV